MLTRNSIYEYDIGTVKQLGDYKIKVTHMSVCRMAGYEPVEDNPKNKIVIDTESSEDKQATINNTVNTKKLTNNLTRAKSKINELALCNPWDFFVTFTIDPTKYDRYDLKSYYKDFSELIHNLNKYRTDENKIKYLFIPEMHKDGAWHIHGLLHGLHDDDLTVNKNGYLSWKKYEEKFGYISLSYVNDKERVASYIVKYITKDMEKNVTELGYHLYYASKGLKKAKLLYRGPLSLLCPWDYEHPDGYCKMKTFDIRTDNYTDYLVLG